MAMVDSPKRFFVLCAPTGSGKSITIAAYLKLMSRWKSMYLTESKQLQRQLRESLGTLGWNDVRGQSNYDCVVDPPYTVDMGPCHEGVACSLIRDGGCHYYDARRAAELGQFGLSNYSWWLHNLFPPINCLVLDEGHVAPDALAEYLSATFTTAIIKKFFNQPPPTKGWSHWAKHSVADLERQVEDMKRAARQNKRLRADLRTLRALLLKVLRLATAKESDWVIEKTKYGYRFDPTWPAPYRELLFRDTPKVILVSATIRPKTLEILGIKPDEYEFHETPSTFAVARRPIYHVPTVRLTYRSTDSQLRLWLARLDRLAFDRRDRKGLIHAVSYQRRNLILRNSVNRDRLITHESGQQETALARFIQLPERQGPIFLSPSATQGLDLAHDKCRYIIWAKVPFPDQRSKILKARAKIDRDYPMYLTALKLEQGSGRGNRFDNDWCETLIVDDQILWFVKKFKRFFTRAFLQAFKRLKSPPAPMKEMK